MKLVLKSCCFIQPTWTILVEGLNLAWFTMNALSVRKSVKRYFIFDQKNEILMSSQQNKEITIYID